MARTPGPLLKPYLDSSVFIAWIKGEKVTEDGKEVDRGDIASHILEDAQKGRYSVYCSTFVAAEVIKDRNRPKLTDAELQTIDNYFQHEFIIWVDLDLSLALEARALARAHSLKPPDAVHLASAIRADCDYLLRWDAKWAAGTYGGVEVRDPFWLGQGSLPGTA